ncbi:MAG: O-antigen/teichoic acid export membrane protein [Crocinitomicaceae bacterium]|jgi:O-antigen/teichoic acid export membrane protein
MMKVVRWLGTLAQDYKRCFMVLMTGQCIFFVGIALFYMSAKHYDAQPLLSELVAFFGMLLIVIGVVVALIGYLSLTYGRWYHFFRRRPNGKKKTAEKTEFGIKSNRNKTKDINKLTTSYSTTDELTGSEENTSNSEDKKNSEGK